MATTERSPLEATPRPPSASDEGMDAYPTYRDGPTTPHVATGTKPTDVGLPPAQRTYSSPFLLGLIIFALLVLGYVLWGAFRVADRTDDAMAPRDPAAPAATAPATSETPSATIEPAPEATLDGNEQPQSTTGPAEIGAAPGAVDVPGGGAGDPPESAPAQ